MFRECSFSNVNVIVIATLMFLEIIMIIINHNYDKQIELNTPMSKRMRVYHIKALTDDCKTPLCVPNVRTHVA